LLQSAAQQIPQIGESTPWCSDFRLRQGQSNKEIGRALGISPETGKTHLEHVYGKLAVERRAQAIARAKDLALLVA
jgi:DNA-binding NarL/FixJ family response regulator